MSKTVRKQEPAERRAWSGREKCQAVLAIWSERRKPAEVCRELGIKWNQLQQWQERAMEGMLSVLEPRTQQAKQRCAALGPRLEKLLEKKVGKLSKLESRLAKIQQQNKESTPAK